MNLKNSKRREFLKLMGTTSIAVPASLYGFDAFAQSAPIPITPSLLPRFSTTEIKAAMAAKITYHDWSNSAHIVWHGGAINPFVMALNSYSGDTSTDAKLLEQMRSWIEGSRSPVTRGGYSAQHEIAFLASFLLVKNTPRLYAQLTTAQKTRYELIAKSELIANCFVTSDKNPYILAKQAERTITGDTNVGKTWNPNYQIGMHGCPILAAYILGGGTEAQNFLNTVKISDFTKQLQAAGLTNAYQTYTSRRTSGAPSFAQIESALRNWTYTTQKSDGAQKFSFSNLSAWAINRASFVFKAEVNTGLNDGDGIYSQTQNVYRGKMMRGQSDLKNLGVLGMATELDASDAVGPRSSMSYSFKGMRGSMFMLTTLFVLGHLNRNTTGMTELRRRMNVGIADFKYKSVNGYRSYAKGGPDKKASNSEDWIVQPELGASSHLERDYKYNLVMSLYDRVLSRIY